MNQRDMAWKELSEREEMVLLPWSDFEYLSERMDMFCESEDGSVRELINRFGPTRSATYAVALLATVCKATDRVEDRPIELLLHFFSACRLRCHWGMMVSLLSKVNYVLQRDRLRGRLSPEEQQLLLHLCLSGLELCEQLSQEHWYGGQAEDIIQLVSHIIKNGYEDEIAGSDQGRDLILLLARANGMLARVQASRQHRQ